MILSDLICSYKLLSEYLEKINKEVLYNELLKIQIKTK